MRYLLSSVAACYAVLEAAASPFQYDQVGRLKVSAGVGGSKSEYTYDAAGNITAMTVTASNATPALTSEAALYGQVGIQFQERLSSTKDGTTFSTSSLPPGLSLSGAEISGVPSAAGVFTTNVALSSGGQNSSATVKIHIRPASDILWSSASGSYGGTSLADSGRLSAGTFNLSIGSTGSFSGVFFFRGERLAIGGVFQIDGTFAQTIVRNGKPDITVRMSYDRVSDAIGGTVTDGTVTALVSANRGRGKADDIGRFTGAWTFALSPIGSVTGAPKGHGVGVVSVKKNGAGTFVASLPDGASKVSGKLIIDKRGRASMVAPLYQAKGFLAGELTFENPPVLGGEFHWSYPAAPTKKLFKTAFERPLLLVGSRLLPVEVAGPLFAVPDVSGNARLTIGRGTFSNAISEVFSLRKDLKGLFDSPNASKLSLSIAKTGLLSGTFLDPTSNKLTKIGGVVLQAQVVGTGFFVGEQADGLIEMAPAQ